MYLDPGKTLYRNSLK